jgi:hypothetical protein
MVQNVRKMTVEVNWCCFITPIRGAGLKNQRRSLCIMAFYVTIYEIVTTVLLQVAISLR